MRLRIILRLTAVVLAILACARENRAPVIASFSGPLAGGMDTAHAFVAVATDPDGDALSIRFIWEPWDTSDWSDWVSSGESVVHRKAWYRLGAFRILAQVKDEHGRCDRPEASTAITISNVRWKTSVGVRADGAVAVADDGAVVVSARDGLLYCLNPDASVRWSRIVAGSLTDPVIGDDGTIYVGSADGLFALSPDGQVRWQYVPPRCTLPVLGLALGADGTVYAVADSSLFAVAPDGTERWQYASGAPLSSAISVSRDGVIYIVAQYNWLAAVGPDATLRWKLPVTDFTSAPAIGPDGTLYFAMGSYVCAADQNGTELWHWWANFPCRPPVVGPDGTVYFGSYNYVYALAPNGSRIWSERLGITIGSTAVGADSLLYVGGGGLVYACQPDGLVRWHAWFANSGCGPLTVGNDGVLYVPTSDGSLYALSIRGGAPDASWPMYGHDARHTSRAR
jgi:outer membrane protein assembly factor BamB